MMLAPCLGDQKHHRPQVRLEGVREERLVTREHRDARAERAELEEEADLGGAGGARNSCRVGHGARVEEG